MEKQWYELTDTERKEVILKAGQDPELPPRGISYGEPPKGLRNWICKADGHEDPDNSGLCIHCSAYTD